MGVVLAKCLPEDARSAIARAIPDRDELLEIAERVALFEEELVKKKQKRVEDAKLRSAVKRMKKLQGTLR